MTDITTSARHLPISEVESWLINLTNGAARSRLRVLIENGGTPVAAIVSPDDLRRLDQLDREREAAFAIMDEVREAFKDVPPEEIERETDRILARIREDDALSVPQPAE